MMKTAHQYAISVKMKIVCMGFSYSARFYVNRKASQKKSPMSEALGIFSVGYYALDPENVLRT